MTDPDLAFQQELVGAFLAASRSCDFDALVAVLDPGVALHADAGALRPGGPAVVGGSDGGRAGSQLHPVRSQPQAKNLALVNGAVGLVTVSGGKPVSVTGFTISRGKIVEIDILADPERLRGSLTHWQGPVRHCYDGT